MSLKPPRVVVSLGSPERPQQATRSMRERLGRVVRRSYGCSGRPARPSPAQPGPARPGPARRGRSRPTRVVDVTAGGGGASSGATRRHGRVRRCVRCSRCSRRRRPAPRRVHPPDRRARWPGSGFGATVMTSRRTGQRPASPDAGVPPRRAPTCWTTARPRTTHLSVCLGCAGADLPRRLLRGGGAIGDGGDGRATVGAAEAAGVCERERGEERAAPPHRRPGRRPDHRPEVENRTLKPNVETRKARRASVPST